MSWAQVETFLRDKQGRIYVNPAKDYIQPFELSTDRPNNIITLAPGETAGPFPFTARYDGPIEVFYVKVVVFDTNNVPVTDYNIDWFLEHPGKRKQFSNRMIPLIATAGDAGRPYVLPETIFLPAVQSLQVTFRNNDAVNQRRVELVLGGVKFYPNAAPGVIRKEIWGYIERRERTYVYWQTTDREVVIPASATGQEEFATVPDDTDLEVFKLSARSTGAFRVELRDGQNDRALTGNRIHSSLIFGAHDPTAAGGGVGGSGGVFPGRWATSFLVRRSVQLRLVFDNLTALSNTVKVVLAGRKVIYAG